MLGGRSFSLRSHRQQVTEARSRGREQLTNCAALVILLREYYQCTLPIEVFYNGRAEHYPPALEIIEGYPGVRCTDASLFSPPVLHRNISISGYGFKVFALYMSSFEKVLMLDSDNLPLVEPGQLLAEQSFQKLGNLFWRDYFQRSGWNVPPPEVYEMLGLTPPWTNNPDWATSESGQLLFDRRRHADVLEWLWFIQTHFEYFEGMLLGDKDMFELAFTLADKAEEFAQVHIPPRVAVHEEREDGEWIQSAMLQSVDSGALAFYHRTTRGAKHGRDGEDNPLRRWWPDFITTPVTGHIGPAIIDFNKEKDVVSIKKAPFDAATFKCRSHKGGFRFWRHAVLKLSSKPRRILPEDLSYVRKGEFTSRSTSGPVLEPLAKGSDTTCVWDGSHRISKADFNADNGAQVAVQTLKAFEGALDRVLHHISSYSKEAPQKLGWTSI
ncbi:hypothetical protein WJX74_006283 [Apatococcus lobatus]|uniref:Uncharacterized protein n=1 Tax=Apatococcus lobatus TaxID=904363 RepID=A0AAW1QI03_9CHLO